MNQQAKQEWLDALRSGRYEQGKFTLHNPRQNTYCCLGVACDVCRKHHELPYSASRGGTIAYYGQEKKEEDLPEEVWSWLGISRANPLLEYQGRQMTLSNWNDLVGLSFAQLADLIEQQL